MNCLYVTCLKKTYLVLVGMALGILDKNELPDFES